MLGCERVARVSPEPRVFTGRDLRYRVMTGARARSNCIIVVCIVSSSNVVSAVSLHSLLMINTPGSGRARKLIFLLSLVPILCIIVYLLSPENLSSVFAHLTEQDVSRALPVTIIIWMVVNFTRILVSCNLQDHYCPVRRAQNKAAN